MTQNEEEGSAHAYCVCRRLEGTRSQWRQTNANSYCALVVGKREGTAQESGLRWLRGEGKSGGRERVEGSRGGDEWRE